MAELVKAYEPQAIAESYKGCNTPHTEMWQCGFESHLCAKFLNIY